MPVSKFSFQGKMSAGDILWAICGYNDEWTINTRLSSSIVLSTMQIRAQSAAVHQRLVQAQMD
jgi:hypothetical protein